MKAATAEKAVCKKVVEGMVEKKEAENAALDRVVLRAEVWEFVTERDMEEDEWIMV